MLVDTKVKGVRVRSVYKLLVDRAMERTSQEYAAICGVDARDIEREADAFTSHGRRAVADFYRKLWASGSSGAMLSHWISI